MTKTPTATGTRRGSAPALSKSLIKAIAQGVSKGVPARIAAGALGISAPTFRRWMELGSAEVEHMSKEGTHTPTSTELNWLAYELVIEIRKEASKAFGVYFGTIHRAAKKNYGAAIDVVTRFYGETFGEAYGAVPGAPAPKSGEGVTVNLVLPDNGRGPKS